MFVQHLANQWSLDSRENFGMFQKAGASFSQEWLDEDTRRENDFPPIPTLTVKISDQLKQKCRVGIPHALRRRLWLTASGGLALLAEVGDVYAAAQKTAAKFPQTPTSSFGGSINVISFLPAEFSSVLTDFLHVLWCQNRQITFSPLVPTVSALLLLYMEPPLAYLSIQSMINTSRRDSWYFTLDQNQFLASIQAFRDLCESKCPAVLEHAERLNLNVAHIGLALFPVFFLPFMPLPVALTLFDSFVTEGRKVLVRFCLCLFMQEKRYLLQTTTPQSFINVLVNAMERLSDIESMKKFIQSSFKIFLSRNRHISPLETKALARRFGLLSSAAYTKAKSVLEMLDEDIALSDLIARPDTMDIPNILHFSDFNVQLSNMVLSKATPESIAAAQFNIEKQILERALPSVSGGDLLTNDLFYMIREHLPTVLAHNSAVMVYKMTEHGSTLAKMYEKQSSSGLYVLCIRLMDGHILGAFLSDPIKPFGKGKYYGRGMTFVFDGTNRLVYKEHPAKNQLFLSASTDSIMIGGPRAAIYLEDGFSVLVSEKCETFGSPSLGHGQIADIELYQLTSGHAGGR